MKKNIAFLFLITIVLTACAGANPSPSLSDTTWELVSYGERENPTPALPNIDTTISFNADGNLNGNMGCNSFFGAFKISEDKIEIGPVGSTEMYCEDTMDQEMAVLSLLNGTLTFENDGNTLTIFSEDGSLTLNLAQK
ncbi:MAG: META domain-containing protein [Chloroflexi bacterium]|nr:META domain-containing protein [Chloroflexota bacterium]